MLELLSNKVTVHPQKQHILDVYGREPETLDEVAKCVIAVINNCDSGDRYERKSKIEGAKKLKVLGFSWDVAYGEASNSHSAPLNGKTNWSRRDENAPKSYPGWTGRVWIRYDGYSQNAGSGPFGRTLTHPGTGGGGSYNGPWAALAAARWKRYGHTNPKDSFPDPQIYSWDYRFYLSDWPVLEDSIRQQRVYDKLAGKTTDMRHKFKWEDPATMIKDAEFLAYCATHPKY